MPPRQDPRPLPHEITATRIAAQLSKTEAAKAIGVDRKTLRAWEAGEAVSDPLLGGLVRWMTAHGWVSRGVDSRDSPPVPTEPTAADALELAGRAVEIEELMSYALHRQRLLRQAMQAAGLSLPAGPRTAAGSGAG